MTIFYSHTMMLDALRDSLCRRLRNDLLIGLRDGRLSAPVARHTHSAHPLSESGEGTGALGTEISLAFFNVV